MQLKTGKGLMECALRKIHNRATRTSYSNHAMLTPSNPNHILLLSLESIYMKPSMQGRERYCPEYILEGRGRGGRGRKAFTTYRKGDGGWREEDGEHRLS